jgi:fermentation-respiration switch protein FrsA (DUF1100 family)
LAVPPSPHQTTNRSGWRSLLACLAFGAAAYGLVIAAAYYTQATIIFRPGGLADQPPRQFPIETVSISTADGLRLNGWWLSSPGTHRTVIFFQGNRRQASDHALRLRTLVGLGVNALLFDYRGFGRTQGRIHSENDIYRDGQAAWDYVHRAREIPADAIILWGRSLGGAVAVEVARRQPSGALILESTFFALDEMARFHYPWLPTDSLLQFHFRNGDKLIDIRTPIIVLHSPEDGYIPFEQGLRLYEAASEPKVLIATSGHHLELFDRHPVYRQRLLRQLHRLTFLGRTPPGNPALTSQLFPQ